jgi:hypothetical protein
MYSTPYKRWIWRMLFCVSPQQYERLKAKRVGFAYPDYFDATKSIFIHIPKAAGTSIAMALYGRQIHHHDWQVWHNLNPKKFNDYFKFAVVRDPVSRFHSSFYFLKNGGMNAADKQFADTVLKDFESPDALARALVDLNVQNPVLDWWHFRPQADFVADEHGQSKMDLLIRFENMDAGFKHVAQRLNCKSVALPHLNKTKIQPEVNLEKEARDVLGCLYRKDFILWEEHSS